MKLTLEQIYDAYPVLVKISKRPLPPSLIAMTWRFQRNLKLLKAEADEIEKPLMELAREKYDATETAPGYFQVAPDRVEEFGKERKSLLDVETDVAIALILLKDYPHELSPDDLNTLEWMFDFSGIDGKEEEKTTRKRHEKKVQPK